MNISSQGFHNTVLGIRYQNMKKENAILLFRQYMKRVRIKNLRLFR